MEQIRIIRRLTAGMAALTVAFVCFGASAQAGTFTVTTLAGDSSVGSLHAAMDSANANPGDKDTINFNAGVTGTIALSADLPVLTGPVVITGPGSSKLNIDGSSNNPHYRMFQTDKDLTLTGLNLTNASNDADGDNGGAISSTGSNLVLTDILESGSHARRGNGGGVYVNGGSVTIENSRFSDNAAIAGGGLWIHGVSSASISNTVIINNSAYYFFGGAMSEPNTGGGLVIEDSTNLNIKNSTISNNGSETDGAGFSINNLQSVTIAGTTVADNETESISADLNYTFFGTARIIAGNTTITDSQFLRNYTGGSSLAGLQVVGPVNISRSTFAGNNAAGPFNGLILGDPNAAVGSSLVTDPSIATVSDSTITGNSSGTLGGGLSSFVSKLNLESSTITGNELIFPLSPDLNGAGLLQVRGTATVTNSIVSGNGPTDITALGTFTAPNQPTADYGGYVEGSYDLIGAANGRQFKDLVPGSLMTPTDPKLGPLAYDGDAVTQTMKPATDSPVIDRGTSSLATDQTGLKRTVDTWLPNAAGGNGTDIGAVEVPAIAPPPNKFSFGKFKPNRKKGIATLQVKVPVAGKVQLLGSKTTKSSSKTAPDAGTVVLTVKAKGKALKQLRKKGKTRLKLKVKYSPTGGTATTQPKSVKLLKKKPKKKKHR